MQAKVALGNVYDYGPANLKKLNLAPFFQNGAKSGFEMCFGPSNLGAGAKTRLESRIKEIRCIVFAYCMTTGQPISNSNFAAFLFFWGLQVKSGYGMCFDPSTSLL